MAQDGDNIDRSCTEVFFFDTVDPKPRLPQEFPHELFLSYTVRPMFRHKPDIADWDLANWGLANWGLELKVNLPIAGFVKDPLGEDLGKVRILRASNLTKISGVCIPQPCPP
ncbi:MAG: hypothetical protein PHY05_07185 [Methanothrix sp.]|nr:hypothetical protein [Methanothrix sp.]